MQNAGFRASEPVHDRDETAACAGIASIQQPVRTGKYIYIYISYICILFIYTHAHLVDAPAEQQAVLAYAFSM